MQVLLPAEARRVPAQVRKGEWLGATGEELTDVVAVGIGGSFLGPLFVHTALRCACSRLPWGCGGCLEDSCPAVDSRPHASYQDTPAADEVVGRRG